MTKLILPVVLLAILGVTGCAREYPSPILVELPPLEPDNVRVFAGELFVTTGTGVQRLEGSALVDELEGMPPALENLHDTGEHLWLSRRDTALGWGTPETLFERDATGEWSELPISDVLVSSAVTRGDERWIVVVDGLGSDRERRRLLHGHEGVLDDVSVTGDPVRVLSASEGVLLIAETFREPTRLLRWVDGAFVSVSDLHGWSDDPQVSLVHGRLHVVEDHRLRDVLTGDELPSAPPVQDSDPWNPRISYRGNDHVVLTQQWRVRTGGLPGGAGERTFAQIDRLEGGGWVPLARLDFAPQSAFWLADETLVVCDSSACFRPAPDTL